MPWAKSHTDIMMAPFLCNILIMEPTTLKGYDVASLLTLFLQFLRSRETWSVRRRYTLSFSTTRRCGHVALLCEKYYKKFKHKKITQWHHKNRREYDNYV